MVGILNIKRGKTPHNLKIFESILKYNNLGPIWLDINDLQFWEKIKKVDLLIFRYNVATDLKLLAETIMPLLENYLKIKCYPNFITGWHYDDKIREYYLLNIMGYPVVKSHIFWDKQTALRWAESAEYPVVFKIKAGSQSDGVVLVNNKSYARKQIKIMFNKGLRVGKVSSQMKSLNKKTSLDKVLRQNVKFIYKKLIGKDPFESWDKQKNYVLFQEFQPGNLYDTRVMVIANQAYGFRRLNRENDFRASGSSVQDHDQTKIDMRIFKLAFKISREMSFQSMAYDFLFDKNGNPVITEISYIFPMQKAWPGYWDENLVWHSEKSWPQFLILKDCLENKDLIQPEINSEF